MKVRCQIPLFVLVASLLATLPSVSGQGLPATDQRAAKVKDLNTPRIFPEIKTKSEWQARAKEIREQALISCGLWPMPEKSPLKAKVFEKVERDGYSVEKVHFQSFPGYYVAGNLYRPVGKGNGPFPGILNPHGHWRNGRMADEETGSIAARCISFARQGMVAFSWDMAGYNDMIQLGQHRKFLLKPELELWNISLMGLQTWNSIRALDFLAELSDVDPARLACTGESGGGTQTFMLGAVDDRLAAQAPIVMVSHTMQGGCQCENAPGLRVDYFNVEIAASVAPRPQMLVACTGDWTKATLQVEGPALDRIYALFKAPEKVRYEIFNFNHNYNKTSREAVYPWFGKWLLHSTDAAAFKEAAYKKEPDAQLRVFPGDKLPADALDEKAYTKFLMEMSQSQLEALKPHDKKSLAGFKQVMTPAWQHTLQVEMPERNLVVEPGETVKGGNFTATQSAIGRNGRGDRLPVVVIAPGKSGSTVVVLAHANGKAAYLDRSGAPAGLARKLVDRGLTVVLADVFLTGELWDANAAKSRKQFEKFFTTYNRTDLQERVQDLITVCAFAEKHARSGRSPVILCGEGRAGLWALLAAPAVSAVVADADALNATSDEALLSPGLFAPGLRKMGGFDGAASLAAPNPLVLHNASDRFSKEFIEAAYAAAGATKNLQMDTRHWDEEMLATQIAKLKVR
jgi:dienelactone hydrolase